VQLQVLCRKGGLVFSLIWTGRGSFKPVWELDSPVWRLLDIYSHQPGLALSLNMFRGISWRYNFWNVLTHVLSALKIFWECATGVAVYKFTLCTYLLIYHALNWYELIPSAFVSTALGDKKFYFKWLRVSSNAECYHLREATLYRALLNTLSLPLSYPCTVSQYMEMIK